MTLHSPVTKIAMPKKQYPAFYDKAIPIALAVITVLVIVLLAVIGIVLSGA